MANAKIETLLNNIQKLTSCDFEGDCIQFIDSSWGLCRDNCESRLTGLLGGFQGLYKYDLTEDLQSGCDKICKFLEQFSQLVRALNIKSAEECKNLIQSADFAVKDIDTLIRNVMLRVKMNTPDIKCIADALKYKESSEEQYVVGYSRITPDDLITVPGILIIGSGENQEVRPVPVNVRSMSSKDTWFVSTVTSNIDEDRLERRNQKKTTMTSRKRLYPIFARVPTENIPKLKMLLPNCGKTCIPNLECEIRAAFPARKGE